MNFHDGDGRVFFTTKVNAFFNPKTLTWTSKARAKQTALWKKEWLLPNGKVILVDTQDVPNSEILIPRRTWSSARQHESGSSR